MVTKTLTEDKSTILAGLVTAAAVVIFTFSILAKPLLESIKFGTANYLVFHSMIELFTIFVAFSIFAVGWHTFKLTKNTRSLFLGIAFWTIGILDLFHALSYQGMPAFITSNSPTKTLYFWLVARLVMAISFLVSGFISPDSRSKLLFRPILLSVFLPIPIVTFVVAIFFG